MSVNAVLARLRGAADSVLALAALGAVALLVAPLPPAALDVALALNLALAATVLVVALHGRDPLRLASFPVLLLLTTLLRLALNVSSTRLVLSRGEAGRVIQAFGQVVIRGNYVVGAVIFAILALIQLLVVAKGAERVAEVAARFTLDALPGKQMAIDADLRSGALDLGEAARRRRALERESQLYGAMDGALKFVKGDALAGLAIVLVNVVGGLVAGLSRGLPLPVAARRYALLAIGDGLVSQIPALLIAVAAGVAVTRVAAEEAGGGLGEDIGRQLFSDARALGSTAALCGVLALVPGLPAVPFLALAGAAALGAWAVALPSARAPALAPAEAEARPYAPSPRLVVEVSRDLLDHAEASGRRGGELVERLREETWRDLGVRLPDVALCAGNGPAGSWRLLLDEIPAAAGRVEPDRLLVLAPPDELALAGIEAAAWRAPAGGAGASLVARQDGARAAALGPVLEPLDRVAAEASAGVRAHAHLLVGIQEVQVLLEDLEASSPALVREVSRHAPPALLAEVLRHLLEERVSIRPIKTILEAILAAGGPPRGAPALAEACRAALRRHIAHGHAASGPLEALLIDPEAEASIRSALAGVAPALAPETARSFLEALESELARAADRSPVLLTASDVRRAVRQLVAARFPALAVLSYEELPANLTVRPLARVAIAA